MIIPCMGSKENAIFNVNIEKQKFEMPLAEICTENKYAKFPVTPCTQFRVWVCSLFMSWDVCDKNNTASVALMVHTQKLDALRLILNAAVQLYVCHEVQTFFT